MFVLAMASASAAIAPQPTDGSADALRSAWSKLDASRKDTTFREPLHLQSAQSSDRLSGTLYAVLPRPFRDVRQALDDEAGWCAALILDPNVHECRPQRARVDVAFGESETPVAFSFHAAPVEEYLQVRLAADDGPFGTKDHVIVLEASPLDNARTIVRLSTAQTLTWTSRLAMTAYFNTVGRGKVGFTVVDRDGAGQPVYVGHIRGGVERNLVRQYFAILAYLDSLAAPREEQADRRVRTWLAYTERYPLQLHENRDYFERKSPEVRRQQRGG